MKKSVMKKVAKKITKKVANKFKTMDLSGLKKGALDKTLGVKSSEKIPDSMLQKALNSKTPLTRKRAQFAKNAKTWNHSK